MRRAGSLGHWPERSMLDGRARRFMDGFAAIAQVQARGVARPEDGNLFRDLDAIDEVGSLAEAVCGEITVFLVVQDQTFSHGI